MLLDAGFTFLEADVFQNGKVIHYGACWGGGVTIFEFLFQHGFGPIAPRPETREGRQALYSALLRKKNSSSFEFLLNKRYSFFRRLMSQLP